MSMYGDYIREREGKFLLETDYGFATYKISGDNCYIVDIYVTPVYRKQNHAAEMADKISEIAISRGCTKLLGTVAPGVEGATESLKVLLAYGFKLDGFQNNLIWFIKPLGE